MKAEEKAKQLVNKFREHSNGTDYDDRFSPAIEKENAKQCALIAVDEIDYQLRTNIPNGNHTKRYWLEVKNEIKKL